MTRLRSSALFSLSMLALAACSGHARKADLSPDVGPTGSDEPADISDFDDDCGDPVGGGTILLLKTTEEFPIYECEDEADAGTPADDASTPTDDGTDAGTPPAEPDASVPTTSDDAGTTPGGDTDAGTPPQEEPDAGTPPVDVDGGTTPPEEEIDAGLPPSDDDAGTPPQGEPDSGTPSGETDAGCDDAGVEGDGDGDGDDVVDAGIGDGDGDGDSDDPTVEDPTVCNRKITVVAHSGETTTSVDEVLQCTFSIEHDAVNTRVVRSCDHETEMAETKVIGVVGESGQIKLILTTPHRCGHYHAP